MARLALLRHGPTAWTAERRLQGRTDLPLSPAGRAAVTHWQMPREVDGFAWMTSPLKRARETAALLGHGEARIDPRLIEMSFGEWEGRRLAELAAELGPDMAALEDRGLDFCAPGGESPREVQQRLAPFLLETGKGGIDRLAVAHKAVIRALYAQATGWPMVGKPPQRLTEFALHVFAVAHDGGIALSKLNLPLTPPGRDGAAGRANQTA
ncbi:MAG TPA: histidine phosphatase family protein [Dongiaceae bacterium]|jgi:probable phosphoglycerate mutase